MGILPLRFPAGIGPQTLQLQPGDRLEVTAPADELAPRCEITVRVLRASGDVEILQATAAVETQLEVALLRSGGVIPLILSQTIAEHTAAAQLQA